MSLVGLPEMNGVRKAAILLVLLGEEAASSLCQSLPEQTVHQVIHEISTLGPIPPDIASQVLEEYYRRVNEVKTSGIGDPSYASRILVRAFGEDKAKEMLSSLTEPKTVSSASLHNAHPQELARLMESEHPQTIALILAHLGANAAPALLLLPEKLQTEAIRRLANLNDLSPDTVQNVLGVLDRKIKMTGEKKRRAYGGTKAVAELLNRLDSSSAKAMLEAIEQSDPKQAIDIRNWMFTFDDLVSVPDSGIRELLSQIDKKTLSLALKGAAEEVRSHFLKAMSSRAVEMLKEDMQVLGPVRVRDVDHAKQEIVATARKLESEGKLSLKGQGDEYVM